jgi:hypothetical protein
LAAFQEEEAQPTVPPPEQPLIPPEQPTIPTPDQPTIETPTIAGADEPQLGLTPDQLSNLLRESTSIANSAGSGTTGGEATAQGATDLGQLLSQSSNVDSVDVQRRSPVALDPSGYRQGQI